MFTKMFKKRNFICPGCKKHLLRELKEPPCSVCGWDGDLTRIDPKTLTGIARASYWMMIPMGLINFALALYFGFLAFHEPFWLIWFVGGNSAVFAYAVWKFLWQIPRREKRGQKKNL